MTTWPLDDSAIHAHYGHLRALARDLIGDPALAEDVVQEAWVAALERPPRGGVGSWLRAVVRHKAADAAASSLRRADREALAARLDRTDAPPHGEADAVMGLAKGLIAALDDLPELYREVLILRYLQGDAPGAIAARLRLPLNTVKTRLRRGLEQLREALDKRHGGDRATWMSAFAALGVRVDSGVGTGTLVIGGVVMGTMMKVSVAVLVGAACVYFAVRTPRADSPRVAVVEPPLTDVEFADVADVTALENPVMEAAQRRPVPEEPRSGESPVTGAKVLRVILEGVTEEYAGRATVTVAAVEEGGRWGARIEDSWPSQGLTSEFDLDPLFARLPKRPGGLRDDELVVVVDHPLHFSETTRVPLSSGVERKGDETVFEVRVRLAEVLYWPELTLAVRDARTRAHLEDVELRVVPTAYMGLVQQPGASDPFTVIGAGLSSPIVMRGGRKAGEPEDRAAGVALESGKGAPLQPAELSQPEENARGVMMYARAPGHAWGRLVLDVSKGAERELLLEPGAALSLRVANVQLERYAALEMRATLFVRRTRPDGSETTVWSRSLDETLEAEALRIEALEPGEYAVLVELSESWQRKPTELGRETISIPAGEARELLLVVPDPPEPPVQATLAGMVSFPEFGGEENVRIEFYRSDYRYGDPDVELALTELDPVAAALPAWSFRLEGLSAGRYQVRVLPFLKSWMIELPDGGREDVELVIPELAEVLVETVDSATGERVPFESIAYKVLEVLPGQVTHGGSGPWFQIEFAGEPGRFRFWTAPGAMAVTPRNISSGVDYGSHSEEFELAPGPQSLLLEVTPACILRFEFRVDGAALPHEDAVFHGLSQCIRAVGHDGRVGGLYPYSLLEASAPGPYEIDFEGVGADRFLPIPPRRIDVHAGETTDVIVELRRR